MAHVWSNRNLDPIELASLYEWFGFFFYLLTPNPVSLLFYTYVKESLYIALYIFMVYHKKDIKGPLGDNITGFMCRNLSLVLLDFHNFQVKIKLKLK